jgi:tight adherence protein B
MTSFLAILIFVWGSAMLAWWLVSRYLRNADLGKVRTRLLGAPVKKAKAAPKKVDLITKEDLKTGRFVLRLLQKLELQDRLQTMLEQAGLKWSVARLVHACLGCFLVTFGIAWLFLPPQMTNLAFLPALLSSGLPLAVVARKRSARIHRFEEQFPESLEFVARSMRAGHGFSVSLEMIHREFQEPLAGEFRRTFEEHNLGMPLELALEKLGQRVPLLDVQFFVSAVMLQKRTGGNLAEILDKLAYIIRERFKLRGRIRAISAHGRMTGMALTCIPIGVAVLMFWVNPDYVRFFFTEETGNYMMGGAVLLQILGYLIIQKIVSIEI